ncbi:MAG: hypothetical protein KC486_04420 [Myxococcales bacterium]|nr:hypothetical protein [Myxococcales bacterium]
MSVSDKTMFEIYREADYNRAFRFLFYTELEEHARDEAIARAVAGDTILSGFIADERREEARAVIEAILAQLNDLDEEEADAVTDETVRARLEPFLIP